MRVGVARGRMALGGTCRHDPTSPDWSPDGCRLAFEAVTSVNPDSGDINREIFTADRRGRGLRRVTSSGGDASDPAWSPSGTYIAYSSNDNVYRVRSSGGGRRLIVRHGGEPSWQPVGR